MDEELMCESLIKWLKTFEGIKSPHNTVEDLTTGEALCECLAEIAPDWFDDEWLSKIRHDTANNRRLKANNLKKLVKGIHDYYTEVLSMDITGFPMPDVNAIAESGHVVELGRLLQLILGCAVNCEDKQEYIQIIMSMEQSVQHVVMMSIQELMSPKDASNSSIDGELYKELELQHKRTVERLTNIMADKEELSQRCHELDEQLSFSKEREATLQTDNDKLQRKLNHVDSGSREDSSFSSMRLSQLQHQVEKLQEENFILETSRDEFRIKFEQQERDSQILNDRNEQLQSLAEESQQLKDEMDELRHSQEKVAKYESTIEMYKKKLEELSDMRRQMKSMEEKNVTYMQETMNLEEDLRKANALKTQVETYKKQVHHLQVQLSDLHRRTDKAEFEARKAKEKMANYEGENERLRHERDNLKEENEELELSHVTGFVRHSSTVSEPSEEFLALSADVLSPEVKERLLRLEHENKKLKVQSKGVQEEQVQLLQNLLNDANERKEQLEKENREHNKKIMELESDVDDLKNQQTASKVVGGSAMDKKYREHLDKLKEANEELQKKKAYIDSLEPKAQSSSEKVNELQGMLVKKEQEMKVMEDRYKKYLDKAKNVIKTLDPKQNTGSAPELQVLKTQLHEKDKMIEHLERDHEKMRITREREEKLIVSAWYEMGMQLHRKAAEERLSGSTGGLSFLARQRQASSRRTTTTARSQNSAASARDT